MSTHKQLIASAGMCGSNKLRTCHHHGRSRHCWTGSHHHHGRHDAAACTKKRTTRHITQGKPCDHQMVVTPHFHATYEARAVTTAATLAGEACKASHHTTVRIPLGSPEVPYPRIVAPHNKHTEQTTRYGKQNSRKWTRACAKVRSATSKRGRMTLPHHRQQNHARCMTDTPKHTTQGIRSHVPAGRWDTGAVLVWGATEAGRARYSRR